MLTNSNGKSILRVRWGAKRSPSVLIRVDSRVRLVLDQIKESDRRRWLTAVILCGFRSRVFDPVLLDPDKTKFPVDGHFGKMIYYPPERKIIKGVKK